MKRYSPERTYRRVHDGIFAELAVRQRHRTGEPALPRGLVCGHDETVVRPDRIGDLSAGQSGGVVGESSSRALERRRPPLSLNRLQTQTRISVSEAPGSRPPAGRTGGLEPPRVSRASFRAEPLTKRSPAEGGLALTHVIVTKPKPRVLERRSLEALPGGLVDPAHALGIGWRRPPAAWSELERLSTQITLGCVEELHGPDVAVRARTRHEPARCQTS